MYYLHQTPFHPWLQMARGQISVLSAMSAFLCNYDIVKSIIVSTYLKDINISCRFIETIFLISHAPVVKHIKALAIHPSSRFWFPSSSQIKIKILPFHTFLVFHFTFHSTDKVATHPDEPNTRCFPPHFLGKSRDMCYTSLHLLISYQRLSGTWNSFLIVFKK